MMWNGFFILHKTRKCLHINTHVDGCCNVMYTSGFFKLTKLNIFPQTTFNLIIKKK